MTRFARIHAEFDVAPSGLAELASRGGLDLLQIDYERPRHAAVTGPMPPELPERASSFADALHSAATRFFLEPSFCVVTSSGWSSSYLCAESAARVLLAAGCPDVPVSAVRGSNVLPILDDLSSAGVRLDNVDTGAPWRSLRAPILAADLEFGAGPLAAALAEGGRVVIAGAYDGAAPFIAAAARQFDWSWKEVDRLAGAAAAARAALWPHRHACEWLSAAGVLPAAQSHPWVEIDAAGRFSVDLDHGLRPVHDAASVVRLDCDARSVAHAWESVGAERLRQWLQTGDPQRPIHDQADVRWDASRAEVTATGPAQLRIAGIVGGKAEEFWRLKVLYLAGFLAETMVEFAPAAAAALRGQIAEAFRSHFVDADAERSLVTAQELASAEGDPTGASWLHLACRSKSRQPCVEFADHVVRFAAANPTLVRLPAGRPMVQAECAVWPARLPHNAVDVAVDTRPAREWE